ncbi:alpha/beta fold hydrolase [Amycolatopsis taiwanensis]|uniref:alpha/beta fold hydrolase n=1 Tax=Amycolatopsis taiwanensis TaxID=342230 RepID=UPI000488D399|nr:alpha/beta fold hydrolase [Amycolatopsis taiwanensis]
MTTVEIAPKISRGAYELVYREAGSGPVLVMLHGSGPGVSGMSNYAANLPVLARTFRTIVVDMPGFGDSPEVPHTKPYPEHAAEAVVSLLADLGVDKAHLVGNSMGGFVALETAFAHPERVDRMVLMGPGGIAAEIFSPPVSEGARRLFDFMSSPSEAAMRAWVDTMVSNPASVPEDVIRERTERALAPGAIKRMRNVFASLGKPSAHGPMWTRTGRISHRTLVTWGRDDRMLPLEGAFFATRRMPNADLHIFANCGHWAQVERKEAFEALLAEFLTAP